MSNHVINEIVWCGVDAAAQKDILAKVCNAEGYVDFAGLVPIPANVWLGNVGEQHRRLGTNALDWCRDNWGTKWNAYGMEGERYAAVEQTADTLTIRFQSASSPPYPWIVALFNTSKTAFEHRWLSEGGDKGYVGKWDFSAFDRDHGWAEPWKEGEADPIMQRHLHKLLWGVEEFAEEV